MVRFILGWHRKDGVYEARFHRKGIDVEVSSKDLNTLKDKFIEKLNNKEKLSDPKPIVGTYNSTIKTKSFAEYATEWLNVKSVTTKPSTYKEYVRMIEHDILPVFGNRNAMEIERNDLQKFLLGYVEKGVLRTAHKLWLVLRCIFDMVAEDNGKPSPMNKVVVPNYEAKKVRRLLTTKKKRSSTIVLHTPIKIRQARCSCFCIRDFAAAN